MIEKRLKRKLTQNNEGITAFQTVILLVILFLFAWEFGLAEYLGYPSFSDYIEDYSTPDEITFSYTVNDVVSHNQKAYETWFFGEGSILGDVEIEILNTNEVSKYTIETSDNPVSIDIVTNAPVRFDKPYYFRVFLTEIEYNYDWYDSSTNSLSVEKSTILIHEKAFTSIGDLWNKQYSVDLEGLLIKDKLLISDVQSNYIEIYFYNPNAQVLFYDYFIITQQSDSWW